MRNPPARPSKTRQSRPLLHVLGLCVVLASCTVHIVEPGDALAASALGNRASPARQAAEHPVDLNFRILEARARIGSRDYVLDFRNRPVITAVGENTYRLDLTLRRDARSSLRGDETLTTHFYYDGTELVFFGDKNRNQRFDRREAGVRNVITHTREFVTQGNKRFAQPRNLDVTLRKEHLSSYQRVDTLWLRLVFEPGR